MSMYNENKELSSYDYSIKRLLSDIRSDIKRKAGSSFKLAVYYTLFYPTIKVLIYYRISHYLFTNGFPKLAFLVRCFQGRYGCYISECSVIGNGVHFPHPVGIVIGEGAVVEDDVIIYQNVTIGSHGKPGLPQEYPYICQGAKIYAGAVLIGSIKIGPNAVVGANSVVLADVKENSLAVGVPFKG